MSWKVWKDVDERAREEWRKAYEKGVNQRKWQDAINHFKKAAELFRKSKDQSLVNEANKAIALAWLFTALLSPTANNLLSCSKAMEVLGNQILKIPYDASASDICAETRLLALKKQLEQRSQAVNKMSPNELKNLSSEYEHLAQEFLAIQRDFVINKLFNITINGFTEGQRLLGFSRWLLGKSEELENPTKALEYYSEALGYLRAAAIQDSFMNRITERIQKLGVVAKCWFCGREIQGEEIHFVYIDATFTPYMHNRYASERPPAFSSKGIVVCNTCYTSLTKLSDKIARVYYEKAMRYMREAVGELQAKINELVRLINLLQQRSYYTSGGLG